MSEGTCLGVVPLKAGVLGIAAVQVQLIKLHIYISYISYPYLKKNKEKGTKKWLFLQFGFFIYFLSESTFCKVEENQII